MFESAALGRACSNKEFEEKAPQLRMRLFNAQLQCIGQIGGHGAVDDVKNARIGMV